MPLAAPVHLRIVAPSTAPGECSRAQDTRVCLPDGTEVHGITRIELVCEVNSIWRARIDAYVAVDPIVAQLVECTAIDPQISQIYPEAIDVTALDDADRRFDPVSRADTNEA